MIREAIQYIEEIVGGKILTAHGRAYSRHELEELESPEVTVEPINIHSLSGFVDYVKECKEHLGSDSKNNKRVGTMVLVKGPRLVSLVSYLIGNWEQRDTFIEAAPFVGKDFPFNRYLEPENFIIGLQTNFVQDKNTEAILKMVGNLQANGVKTVIDDGISQEVTVRKGVTKVANEIVKSRVSLRPFRTFQDIEQPESLFLLRLRREDDEGMPEVALFEVDDKQWQLTAVRDIKIYLDEFLPKELVLA